MTKEELKAKLISDPEARRKFLTATSDYYKSIGLTATKEDLDALSENLEGASKPNFRPIIIIFPFPIPPVGRE